MTVQGPSSNAAIPASAGAVTPDGLRTARTAEQQSSPSSSEFSLVPDGASPELWNMLTDDERAFFLKQTDATMTYGPVKSPSVDPAAPRGHHIDARA